MLCCEELKLAESFLVVNLRALFSREVGTQRRLAEEEQIWSLAMKMVMTRKRVLMMTLTRLRLMVNLT